jgi:uncharacterized membrane protein YtjA (UPF0391 family)
MLGWALLFVIVTLIAAAFGFFVLAGVAGMIAKVVFLLFIALLIVSGLSSALRGVPPV